MPPTLDVPPAGCIPPALDAPPAVFAPPAFDGPPTAEVPPAALVEVVFEPPSAFEVLVSSASDDPPAARFVLPVHDAPPTGDVSDAVFVPLPALDPEQPDRAIDASDVKSVILESISNLTSQGKPKGRAGKRLRWWAQYID